MPSPKPHVSRALAQLRHSVAVAAMTVATCAAVQLLVFGFTHFTTVRWEYVKPRDTVQELAVISATEPAAGKASLGEMSVERGRKVVKLSDVEATQNARELSRWDGILRNFSALAGASGTIAAFTLSILTLMGVFIAGGASVPGVERAVTSATWSLVLGLVCIPWRDVMPSIPFAGVFGGYPALTAASEAVLAGKGNGISLFAGYLLLPTMALAVAILVWFQFREGVDRGIIVTTISDLELTVEHEMESVRSRGVVSHVGPRSTGALHMAIGERPVSPSAPSLALASGGDPSRPKGLATDRRIGEPDPGDPLKRPI